MRANRIAVLMIIIVSALALVVMTVGGAAIEPDLISTIAATPQAKPVSLST